MKMNFTFEEPRHATFDPIEAARQPMASRKYNKYRENQLSGGRTRNIPYFKPWWGVWYEKLPTASG